LGENPFLVGCFHQRTAKRKKATKLGEQRKLLLVSYAYLLFLHHNDRPTWVCSKREKWRYIDKLLRIPISEDRNTQFVLSVKKKSGDETARSGKALFKHRRISF